MLFSTVSISQKINVDEYSIPSNNLSLSLIGSPAWPIGITYSQMLSDRISIDIGTGIVGSGAGLNYYLTNPRQRRLNFYTGVSGMVNYDAFPMLYIPVGASYFGKKKFQYSADIGVMFAENVSPFPSFWFGAKVGYRFGKDINELKTETATDKKNIISGNLGFTDILVGVVYERLISPSFSAEVGLGLLGATIGAKYYFLPVASNRVSLFTGVSESIGVVPLIGSTGLKTYVPLGISYLAKNNIRYGFDAGPQFWHQDNSEILLGLNFRIGYAF